MTESQHLPAPVPELTLDQQIELAERQVIARDTRIRHRTHVLVRRIKHDALKHAGGGLLLGAGTIALTWWLNRLGRRDAPPQAPAAGMASPRSHTCEHLFRDVAITLAGLLPMLWPMLPRGVRRSVTPGTAGTLLTYIAPLLGRLFRRRPRETTAA